MPATLGSILGVDELTGHRGDAKVGDSSRLVKQRGFVVRRSTRRTRTWADYERHSGRQPRNGRSVAVLGPARSGFLKLDRPIRRRRCAHDRVERLDGERGSRTRAHIVGAGVSTCARSPSNDHELHELVETPLKGSTRGGLRDSSSRIAVEHGFLRVRGEVGVSTLRDVARPESCRREDASAGFLEFMARIITPMGHWSDPRPRAR